jgi:tetratricopeptide (TPR) repeat protein
MKNLLAGLLAILYSCTLLADERHNHLDFSQKLGAVSFSTSCSKASQEAIEHGLALLHSFLFDDAEDQFKVAATEDSACSMAYWGEAIGFYRLLVYRPTPSDMKQGWELVQKAQTLPPKTPRERDYVEALAVFFRVDQRDYSTRNREYSDAMEKVYKSYPDDQEAAVFYALSLLTWNSDSQRPLANSKKAIGILDQVFRENPGHPGAAHYLIHAADTPQLASMGLEAARRYAQIAPAAPHALHMPSHIFARLGLWQEDIQSNLASLKAARDPSGVHVGAENQLHAMEFLEYAYLQIGEVEKAEEMVREQADVGYEQVDKNLVDYVNRTRANSPAMLYLESRNWKAAEALKPDPNAETYNQAITCWAQAVAAGHLRDLATAQQAVKEYDSLLESTKQGSHSYLAQYMSTKHDEAHAWLSFVQGKNDEALGLLRAVADKQDVEGKGEVELPAREMLADMLLGMNRPSEALAEFENSMRVDPNRFNALYGAGRAAELTHQTVSYPALRLIR